jgi:hypothetical protein
MKKGVILSFIVLLFACFLIAVNIQAQPVPVVPDDIVPELPDWAQPDPKTGLPEPVEKVKDKTEEIIEEIKKRKYLTREYQKLLFEYRNKSRVVALLWNFHLLFRMFSPVFELLTGVEYSLSWYFLIVILLWLAVVMVIHSTLTNAFEDWGSGVILLLSIVLPTLASQVEIKGVSIFAYLANLFVPLITNIIMLILALALLVLIVFLFDTAMQELKRMGDEEEKGIVDNFFRRYWRTLKKRLGGG